MHSTLVNLIEIQKKIQLKIHSQTDIIRLPTVIAVSKTHSMNNILPSRLVTALSGKSKNQKIPFECSLGVVHEKTQKKRFSWSLISAKYKTYIHLNFNNILKPEKKFQLFFNVYNSKNLETLNKIIYIDICLN